ncbi:MAG TPA: hypothetical protein VN241_05765 [Microbacterium sp.]|nr:hypothetical protein [Microbacterium sp.]
METSRRAYVSRADGFALGLIATGAVSVAAASVVSMIQSAFGAFGEEVHVRMPVTGGEVTALEGIAGVSSAQYAAADVVLTTVPAGARWLLFTEGALPALATIGVCIVAWWLGVSLMRSRPFRNSMSWAIGIAACLVVAGGVFGQLSGAVGRAVIVERLAASHPAVTDVFWTFLIDLDLAPVGWGFALALIAGAFSIGSRLQRETEGLV